MKNVLVLGTGFISKNILKQKKHINTDINKVISLSRENNFLHSDRHITSEFSDIQTINSIIIEEDVTVIYIFLGPSFPSISFDQISYDINNCLIPFVNLLELASQNKIKEIVMLGSAGTVYGSKIKRESQEDQIIMQENAYGTLLKAMENYLILYSKRFDLKYKILRLSNVFGRFHENENNGFINIAIRKTLKNDPIKIFSRPLPKNYIFSEDVGSIFWKLNEIKQQNYIVNIASPYDFNVTDICTKIKNQLPNLTIEFEGENSAYDTLPPKIKNLKLNSLINFVFTPFEKAIEETIAWEKSKLN